MERKTKKSTKKVTAPVLVSALMMRFYNSKLRTINKR